MKLVHKQTLSMLVILGIVLITSGFMFRLLKNSRLQSEVFHYSSQRLYFVMNLDRAMNKQFGQVVEFLSFRDNSNASRYWMFKKEVARNLKELKDAHWKESRLKKDSLIDEARKVHAIETGYTAVSQVADSIMSIGFIDNREAIARWFHDFLEKEYYGELNGMLNEYIARELQVIRESRSTDVRATMFLSWMYGVIILITILFTVAIFWIMSKTISRPVEKVSAVLKEMGEGNLGSKIDTRLYSKDEIGELMRGISIMTDNLKSTNQEIKYADTRTSEILDTLQYVARGDLRVACAVHGVNDNYDAVAMAINMMIDDIRNYIEENLQLVRREKELAVEASRANHEKQKREELQALNQQLQASEQQLKTANQHLSAREQQLQSVNQQLLANEQILRANEEELIRLVNELTEAKDHANELNRTLELKVEERTVQLKESTAHLVQAEKLTALGELSASIAHEMSQPLNGIKIICQSIQHDIRKNKFDSSALGKDMQDVVEQVDKMGSIIDHMRRYTRQTTGADVDIFEVHEILECTLHFLNQQMKNHGIEIVKCLCQESLKVSGDQIRLEQVITNLLSNARYAIEHANRPVKQIIIRTKKDTMQNLTTQVAILEIEDNGTGIAKESFSKLFQPFFTTKISGQGTGLGLYISKKIIEEHNGKIEVESCVGEGTTFRIFLPLVT